MIHVNLAMLNNRRFGVHHGEAPWIQLAAFELRPFNDSH